MSNSSLVAYTKLSPNYWSGRKYSISRITPHCVVGQCSVETLGNVFAQKTRQASCNYGIGSDGRVGMYVEEKNSSWCSSSYDNDNRAVTIECASDTTAPYAFKAAVYNSLINLCVDICKRNGKTKLLWLGSKDKALAYSPKKDEMVLTAHRWFANKSCPGDWMYSRMGDLAKQVTTKLGTTTTPVTKPTTSGNTSGSTSGSAEVIYNGLFKVQVGAFRLKSNAEKYLKEAKAKGFDGFVTKVGTYYKVQIGAFSKKANADALLAKVKAAGFKNAFVTEESKKKSVDEVAKEVIAGKWGTGSARKSALIAAGYDYNAVQKRVNELL